MGCKSEALACPYDGDFCQAKQDRLVRWKEAIEYMAKNGENRTFWTGPNMFIRCPMPFPSLSCERYHRAKNIRDKIIKDMQNEKQQ